MLTQVTKSAILDRILLWDRPFHGRLDLISFLQRIWNLSQMPSTDSRFENAAGDIWQHMVRNNDWTWRELLTSRLNILGCEDSEFLRFLEQCLHPLVVDNAEQAEEIAAEFNENLQKDGYRLIVKEHISGRPVYAAVDIESADEVSIEEAYEIVLSFAGEDREYVQQVARFLREHDVRCFYDKYEDVTLWGKDLAEHLDFIYKSARYCVMFVSKHYGEKIWPNHERRSALARAVKQKSEYILPARFDDTEVPGLRHTIGYVNLTELTPDELGEMILRKLGRRHMVDGG